MNQYRTVLMFTVLMMSVAAPVGTAMGPAESIEQSSARQMADEEQAEKRAASKGKTLPKGKPAEEPERNITGALSALKQARTSLEQLRNRSVAWTIGYLKSDGPARQAFYTGYCKANNVPVDATTHAAVGSSYAKLSEFLTTQGYADVVGFSLVNLIGRLGDAVDLARGGNWTVFNAWTNGALKTYASIGTATKAIKEAAGAQESGTITAKESTAIVAAVAAKSGQKGKQKSAKPEGNGEAGSKGQQSVGGETVSDKRTLSHNALASLNSVLDAARKMDGAACQDLLSFVTGSFTANLRSILAAKVDAPAANGGTKSKPAARK